MSAVSSIALSGINAATLRLQVSARNVASATSNGPENFGALSVNQAETAGGGTSATVSAASTTTAPASFDTNAFARNADAWAFAANPYVALTNEMVQQLVARFDLIANAQVLRAGTQTQASLLDITV
jgi:flagellar basal-body rod protein FlgC